MPRKIVLRTASGSPVLSEVPAADEYELQELMKANPDLLPIEEFGMTGPLLVIGRETTLPSGAIDLVALARSGEILIIEFKTGPGNPDFRHATSQLIDYGSDIWTLGFDEFESTVPLRYFAGPHCTEDKVRRVTSLFAAARAFWTDFQEGEEETQREAIRSQLESGAFSYVLVAQRFTPSTEKTIAYLNATSAGRFYAVELVRFDGDGTSAFESRTIYRPPPRSSGRGGSSQDRPSYANQDEFLAQIEDPAYRSCLAQLFEVFTGLGLQLAWGVVGVSVRMPNQDTPEPLTLAWIFPPGRTGGWMGLVDFNIGIDPISIRTRPLAEAAVRKMMDRVRELPGVQPTRTNYLKETGVMLAPADVIRSQHQIAEIVADTVTEVNSG